MMDASTTPRAPTPGNPLAEARRLATAGHRAKAIADLKRSPASTTDAETAFTLGIWLLEEGSASEALQSLRLAADLAPNVAAVFVNLATAAIRTAHYREAVTAAKHAADLDDGLAAAFGTLGNALAALGDLTAAEDAYNTAIERAPEIPTWRVNLGHCLLDQRRSNEALDTFDAALANRPKLPAARNGRGLALQQQGKHRDALDTFWRAIADDAGNADAWGNLAVSLQCLGDHEEALAAARRACELRPKSAKAALNLGHILQSLGRHEEAVSAYEQARALDPGLTGTGAYLLHSQRHICRWEDDVKLLEEVARDIDRSVTVPPFALASTSISPAQRLRAAQRSAREHTLESSATEPVARPAHGRPLRVGFVSPDFRTHSMAMSFSGLLAPARQESWIGYATSPPSDDAMAANLASRFDAFNEIGELSVGDAAARVRQDRIDVLVDLAGHTRGGSLDLFALRPAPVQVHYLGYGSTVGSDDIPWLITDRVHTPEDLAPFCSEAIVYLPRTFMAAAWQELGSTPPRDSEGLPDDSVVYACFNAHYKIEPSAFDAWMRILDTVPDSVLWLRMAGARVVDRLRNRARERGVTPDRLIFADREARADHLARHQCADICLDTFNHSGGVTTIDALNAGVPVLSVAGQSQSARTSASILASAGLEDCTYASTAAYEAAAISLGQNATRRLALRERLRAQVRASSLFDSAGLANALNAAFRAMHRQTACGQSPQTFDIV